MKSPRIHFVLVLVLTLMTAASYAFWYITVANKSKEVINLQDQTAAATETLNRIASARAILSEIAGDEARVQSYFLSESGVVAFINDLESRGLPEHATVNVLSVAKGGSPSQPTFVLTLTVKGTFDSVVTTIGSIEYAPYNISVPTLSISQDGKDAWIGNVSLIVGGASATTL